jgi:hypothetical protein
MQTIKVTIKYNSPLRLMKDWVDAVTIGNTIYVRQSKENTDPILVNHELIHVCQYNDRGIDRGFFRKFQIDDILFFLGHYYFPLNQSYRKKPEEVEAYGNQHDFSYIAKRWPQYTLDITDELG